LSLNKRLVKVSFITLILMMSLSFAVFPIQGQGTPKVSVVPGDNIFSTETTFVGDTFTVNIATSGWEDPGLYSFELKLYYDNTLLNATDAIFPSDYFFSWAGDDLFKVPIDINREIGYVLFGLTLLGDLPGSTGSGVLGTVTFEIITAPPVAKSVSCDLRINNIIFLDPDGNTVADYDVEHGYYEFAGPKPALSYLKVLPETVSANVIGDQVVIDITVQGLSAVWRAVGFEWKLTYDPAILGFLNATEGDFLKQFGEVYFHAVQEADYVISFSLLLPPWPPEEFPEGSGTLATLTFEAILAGSCDLTLSDVLIVDVDGNFVETGPHEHGRYLIPLPYLKVLPETVSANVIGDQVVIDITVQGLSAVWRAVGFEWKLTYDPAILGFLNATEGDFLKQFGEVYFHAVQEADYVISFSLLLPPWPPEEFPEGSGTLATLTFEAILAGSCDLTLSDVLIVDVDGNFVETGPHEHGRYTFAPPWLSVNPTEVTLENEGETFNLHVVINEIDKTWKLAGSEFKLRYNTTLLETSEELIVEGDFLKDFALGAGTDTWFQVYLEEEYGLIGILILPLGNGTWPFDVFPEGTGVLASFTFTAIWQHETEDITDYLKVDDILLVDAEAKIIPVDLEKTATEGTCEYTILKAYVPPEPEPPQPERMVDLFTQYDAPYGGQGIGVPSDAFAPQGQAKLKAKVEYRGEAVPGKLVAYQIRGPNGYEFLATELTGSNGMAVLDLSIPASESYFGVWEVTASVDIAGQVVTDFVFFRVGWLVSVKEIAIEFTQSMTENQKEYPLLFKGETYPINSTLWVITMQPPTQCVQLQGLEPKLLLVYSGFDELRQPLFNQYIPMSIGYFMSTTPTVAEMSSFVAIVAGRELDSPMTSITIPTRAYSGVADINGNVFTDFPWYSGVPYSSTTLKQVYIRAAVWPPPVPPEERARTAVLSVSSAKTSVGSIFTIAVTIKDLNPDAHVVGIEFRLKFDESILEVLDVIEGTFVEQFGDTFLTWYIEDGVIVGLLQLPPWPGEIGWMGGSGIVVYIEFRALASGTCFLTLDNAFMVDSEGNIVEFKRLEYGICTIVA